MSEFPIDPQDSLSRSAARKAGRSALRRRRFAPLAVVAGVGATAALALSMTGTLSAFTAQITNSANAVTDGTVIMSETGLNAAGTSTTCTSANGNSLATNTSTCSTINKYGYATTLVPGGTSSATVTISNTGTAGASSFTLEPQACVQTAATVNGGATDLCNKITLTATKSVTVGGTTTTTTIVNGITLDAFFAANKTGGTAGPISLGAVAAGGSQTFSFTVTLPSGTGNTYQGLTATQGLVWLFTAGT